MTHKALLIGNGIYRAFHGEEESWTNVLEYIKKRFEGVGIRVGFSPSEKMSCILYFDYLYAKWKAFLSHDGENETQQWQKFSETINGFLSDLYSDVAYNFSNGYINTLIWDHFDTVLTTNIDNRFEKGETDWDHKSGGKNKYSTYRQKKRGNEKIYYIHGVLGKGSSICFGLDHYLGESRCLHEYFFEDKDRIKNDVSKFLSGEKCSLDEVKENTWLYCLFCRDLDIIGQALDRTEVDIWWALEKRFHYRELRKNRKTSFKDENEIRYFVPSFSLESNKEKLEMLRALDVVPVVIPCSDYREFYKIYFNDFAGDNRCQK